MGNTFVQLFCPHDSDVIRTAKGAGKPNFENSLPAFSESCRKARPKRGGLGDEFDADKLMAYPSGAVIVLPGNTSHFHWAKSGEYITEVTAIGPLSLEYIDLKDDPRNQNSTFLKQKQG